MYTFEEFRAYKLNGALIQLKSAREARLSGNRRRVVWCLHMASVIRRSLHIEECARKTKADGTR